MGSTSHAQQGPGPETMRLAELDLEEKALLQDVLTLDRTDSWKLGVFWGRKGWGGGWYHDGICIEEIMTINIYIYTCIIYIYIKYTYNIYDVPRCNIYI